MRNSSLSRAKRGDGPIDAYGVVSLACLLFGVGLLPLGDEWTLLERVQLAMHHNNMVVEDT